VFDFMESPEVAEICVKNILRFIAANILNKQSQTANKGWSSSPGIRHGANNYSP
jgi:hypothetical protein